MSDRSRDRSHARVPGATVHAPQGSLRYSRHPGAGGLDQPTPSNIPFAWA